MAIVSELGCTYASMILQDDGIPITAEKISALVDAANVKVESYFPGLFAKLAERKNLEDLILNTASAAAAPAATAAAPSAAAAAAPVAAEEKKEEPKEESDDEGMMMDLFG